MGEKFTFILNQRVVLRAIVVGKWQEWEGRWFLHLLYCRLGMCGFSAMSPCTLQEVMVVISYDRPCAHCALPFTLHNVHFWRCTTLCTMRYTAQCTVYSALSTVHCAPCTVMCYTVHSAQCTEHSALCTALHCTVMCRLAPVSTTNKVEERSILFALLNCVLQTSYITGILILLARETHALKSFLFLHCNVFSSLGLILADEV